MFGVDTMSLRKAYFWVFALSSPSVMFSLFGKTCSWPTLQLKLFGSASKKKETIEVPLRVPTE